MTEPFDPDHVVFSADPDRPCVAAMPRDDGRHLPYGGPEYLALSTPLPNCTHPDECGCVLLFIGKDAK